MTDNEILKQLETCTYYPNCPECPYYEKSDIAHECMVGVMRNAYDLINRQQAEIERLNSCVMSEEQVREIMKSQMHTVFKDIIEDATDKAIKEFAEKLKATRPHLNTGEQVFYIRPEEVDNLVKEMVGDE